jgi:uncharacterized DUF497 family protein
VKFEWDEDKNRTNIGKHGIDFEDAKEVFNQPTIEIASDRKNEERTAAYGYLEGHPLVVVYTERGNSTYRLISARLATQSEEQELIRRLGLERRKQRSESEPKKEVSTRARVMIYE